MAANFSEDELDSQGQYPEIEAMNEFMEERYSRREEVANSITHGLGIVLGIVGLVVMAWIAQSSGTAHLLSGCVFGATLILLYTASTLYHIVRRQPLKSILRALDHSAIFLLIAGTYTPFTLIALEGPWGWSLFSVIWGLACIGLGLQFTLRKRYPSLQLALYIAMGWAAIVALGPLLDALSTGGLVLLFAGGVAYTSGVIFYLWRSLPYSHAVWHLFVLAGSTLHFLAVALYVLPMRS
ncbi:MAG: PAQR family membrane homeostasis protein TrhA [Desulfovibrionales bacterium]